MARQLNIEPMTRIEGHLGINTIVERGKVKEAYVEGTLFRGLESILHDRDPVEASMLTQRICGVCTASHAMAAALCLDDILGLAVDIHKNARIVRNIILGANYLQSNILHFYHLVALDYVDITAVREYRGDDEDLVAVKKFLKRGVLDPFVPRYEGDYRLSKNKNITGIKHYVEAFNIRRMAHEMLAIFGGKMPHQCGIVAGGVTVKPSQDKKDEFRDKLGQIKAFIDAAYLPDVCMIGESYPDYFQKGRGCGRLLSFGSFDLEDDNPDQVTRQRFIHQGLTGTSLKLEKLKLGKITEEIIHSWYDAKSDRYPDEPPDPYKEQAYSFVKSPRYGGEVVETGPLADLLVSYAAKHRASRKLVDATRTDFGIKKDLQGFFSIMGRNLARAIETKLIADAMCEWIEELDPDAPIYTHYDKQDFPMECERFGITGAPRGALGHWMHIKNRKIHTYRIVTPTTWNASPRDAKGNPGPIEQALAGLEIKDKHNPFEILRAVRAFDPCMACAVHVIKASGAVIGE